MPPRPTGSRPRSGPARGPRCGRGRPAPPASPANAAATSWWTGAGFLVGMVVGDPRDHHRRAARAAQVVAPADGRGCRRCRRRRRGFLRRCRCRSSGRAAARPLAAAVAARAGWRRGARRAGAAPPPTPTCAGCHATSASGWRRRSAVAQAQQAAEPDARRAMSAGPPACRSTTGHRALVLAPGRAAVARSAGASTRCATLTPRSTPAILRRARVDDGRRRGKGRRVDEVGGDARASRDGGGNGAAAARPGWRRTAPTADGDARPPTPPTPPTPPARDAPVQPARREAAGGGEPTGTGGGDDAKEERTGRRWSCRGSRL